MVSQDLTKFNLPDSPGVYFFKKGKKILYVGKATSLRDRTKSYFSKDLIKSRGAWLVKMILEADSLEYKATRSVLEALIHEALEIKKNQPIYNSQEKDDKSYNFVVITDEEFPKVIIERGRALPHSKLKIRSSFGPFPHGQQLQKALKIVREIFPFRDNKCTPSSEQRGSRPCFNRQIGLCPGVCTGEVTSKQYKKTIRNIELFFSGKTEVIKKNLHKEMADFAKLREFERADGVKRTIFALDHIRDVALISNSSFEVNNQKDGENRLNFRIEAYDVAHTFGTSTVGVMVVIEGGELNKNEYRKFKIRGVSGKVTVDDTKNLSEILLRRLGHANWRLPNLIVVDGGVAQINAAKEVLMERGFNIEIVSVVKNEQHKAREIIGRKGTINAYKKEILLVNAESHRFAIAYHRLLRGKKMFGH